MTNVNIYGNIDAQKDTYIEFSRVPLEESYDPRSSSGSQLYFPTDKRQQDLRQSKTNQFDKEVPQRSFSQLDKLHNSRTMLDNV